MELGTRTLRGRALMGRICADFFEGVCLKRNTDWTGLTDRGRIFYGVSGRWMEIYDLRGFF